MNRLKAEALYARILNEQAEELHSVCIVPYGASTWRIWCRSHRDQTTLLIFKSEFAYELWIAKQGSEK